jgi:hypothetical protein
LGYQFTQQLYLFCHKVNIEQANPCCVATGPIKTGSQTEPEGRPLCRTRRCLCCAELTLRHAAAIVARLSDGRRDGCEGFLHF